MRLKTFLAVSMIAATIGLNAIPKLQPEAEEKVVEVALPRICRDVKTLDECILNETAKHQIIGFTNEHYSQYDDAFVTSLLPALRKQGFNYLVLEIPLMYNGTIKRYSLGLASELELKNIVFDIRSAGGAKMLDVAGKLGYKVMSLDSMSDETQMRCLYKKKEDVINCGKEFLPVRDDLTFENIKKYILDKDPNAKIVVFYGGQHISKSEEYFEYGAWQGMVKTIGYHFNRETDYFSINLFGGFFSIDIDMNFNLRDYTKSHS